MSTSESSKKPIIKVRGLHKYFGDNQIIKGVDLDLGPGEVIVSSGHLVGGRALSYAASTFLKRRQQDR